MSDQPSLVFPNNLIIDVSDIMYDFMEPYKPGGRYDSFDYTYMKRVLSALSTAFMTSNYFEHRLNRVMYYFTDCTLIYSDETYDPSRLMDLARKVAERIFTILLSYGAYVNGVFPYRFADLMPDMAMVLVYQPIELMRMD